MTNSIQGPDRLFRFSELSLADAVHSPLLADMFCDRHDGVVIHGAVDGSLAQQVVTLLQAMPSEHLFHVPVGRVFPISFATISGDPEHYAAYLKSLGTYGDFVRESAISKLLLQIDQLFNSMGGGYSVAPPRLLSNGFRAAEGNFRQFDPGKGGIYSHCGYLFQQQSPYYYKVIEPLRPVEQLSYFVVLQNARKGGELTIYDLLWDNVKEKDSPMGNEYVIDLNGNRIYLSEVRQMKIRPEPGDLVVFRGGPIWHRVEDIHGPLSRITFGGFMNITEDGKGIRYYS